MKPLAVLFKHRFILSILVFALAFRSIYLLGNSIPFSFDHGKDSLAILDMIVNLSPKFIGPWTSIPGLYFGPGWYYLLVPFYLATGFNPVGGAIAMLVLILIQIALANKYFGKYEALIVTMAPLWFILSKSAWNPYPMTLLSFILLIVIKKSIEKKSLTLATAATLGITAAFGFHFSAAFAIFYPICILLSLLVNRVKIRIRDVLATAVGFSIPFIPQLLFELKHNFSQVRAVVAYFQEGESQGFSFSKVFGVVRTTVGELFLAVFPETNYLGSASFWVSVTLLFCFAVILFRQYKHSKEIRQNAILALCFIGIPVLGFCFLHFNVWYVYAMAPAAVVLLGSLLRKSPLSLRLPYLSLLVLGPVIALGQYLFFDKAALSASRGFLPVKLQAIEKIEEIAAGRPYASYHYVPDIYDYSYQYIYFWRAANGHTLPVEFSYKPGEQNYIVQKQDLLSKFPVPQAAPEVLFFIVEHPENEAYLDSWWNQQKTRNVATTIEISPDITVYVATP